MGHLIIACSLANKLLLPFSIIFFFFATTGVQYSQSIEFTYNGFNGSDDLILHNEATVENPSGALRLTAGSFNKIGSAFFGQPIRMLADTNTTTNVNASASSSFSFSTHFVFSIHPSDPDRRGGFGLVFALSPTPNFPGAESGQYLGIFNHTNDGDKENSIFAVEFDTVKGHRESAESVGNHVGIDINGLASVASKPAGYHRLEENSPDKTEDLTLENGERVYAWIDYDGTKVAVTVSPTPTRPEIPLLAYQTELKGILKETVHVGFSAATGAEKSSCHYLLGWSFRMNGGAADSLDVSRLPSPDPGDNCNAYNKSSTAALKASMKLLIAALSAFLILSLGGLLFRKWYRSRYGDDEDMEAWELECPHRFRYRDLHAATKGFSDARVIGSGGFGAVYYGRLLPSAGGEEIAVKKISRDSVQGFKEFVSEIETLGRLRHKHLVNLQGWCKRKNDLLLVYDYVPHGSLDSLLCFRDTTDTAATQTMLGWEQRLNILKGVAAGLLYMHEDWDRVVIHRDVKSSNVLVDDDMNGRLGDFGLARLYDRGGGGDRPSLLTTAVVGTIGYIAPELTRTGKASTRSDVFAFGVLLMEVACGRRPVDFGSEPGHQLLVDRVMESQQMGRILDAADIRMGVEGYAGDEVERVLELGLVCCHPDPDARPSMRQVVRCLNGEPVPATENWSSGGSRRMNDINARFMEVISAGSCASSSIGPISTSSFSLEGGR